LGYPVRSPNPETIAALNRLDEFENMTLRAERRLRDAIADEELEVWVKASNGQMERLVVVRDDWLKDSFGGLGIDQIPYPFVDMEDAPAFSGYLKNSNFQEWLTWEVTPSAGGAAVHASPSDAGDEQHKPNCGWIKNDDLTEGEAIVFEAIQDLWANGIKGCTATNRDDQIRTELETVKKYSKRVGPRRAFPKFESYQAAASSL
jgi:hypothetical protein